MDGYVGFHAAVRCSYGNFIHDLSKQCKQLVLHHFDSVTSPYSQVCYEYDLGFSGASTNSVYRYNQLPTAIFFLDLSDGGTFQDENLDRDQENMPPKDQQHTTPGKGTDSKEILRESQLTVPETPSPDQPNDASLGGKKKENGMDIGARKQHARQVANGKNSDMIRNQNCGLLFGDLGSKSVSSYSDIYSIAAQHFARIRQVLIERNVPSALNSGFLTPCRERLAVALALDLFAVNDEIIMANWLCLLHLVQLMSFRVNDSPSTSVKRCCNLVWMNSKT